MSPNPRREFLGGALAMLAIAATPAVSQGSKPVSCVPGRGTPAQTEGPFYSARAPQKTNFRADTPGNPLVLEGVVYGMDCRPLAGAWLDFWHADAQGAYDNAGYRLRGHQFTDAAGRYRLETVMPALYPGRARHIHVKLRAPGSDRILTTQVYFPDDPGNARDGLYRPELVARRTGDTLEFNFVLGR